MASPPPPFLPQVGWGGVHNRPGRALFGPVAARPEVCVCVYVCMCVCVCLSVCVRARICARRTARFTGGGVEALRRLRPVDAQISP